MTKRLDYLDKKHAAIYLVRKAMSDKGQSIHSISRDDLMIAVGTLMEIRPRLVSQAARRLFFKKKSKR